MKRLWTAHRPLWISLLLTLAAAVLSVTAIACAVMPTAGTRTIQTVAAAQAFRDKDEGTPLPGEPVPTPTPVPGEGPVHAADAVTAEHSVLAWAEAESRRFDMDKGVIPSINGRWHEPYTGWMSTPLTGGAEYDGAIAAANDWMQKLFGFSMKPDVTVTVWTDPNGYRKDYIRVADSDLETIVSMDRETLQLINIDTARTDGKRIPSVTATEQTAKDIIDVFGWTMQLVDGGRWPTMALYTNEGPVVGLSIVANAVASVRVYENVACLEELVYTVADLQSHAAYVEKVYGEPSFVKGEEAELLKKHPDAMTRKQLFALLEQLYRQASGEWPGEDAFTATLYLDETGDREDYWQVTLASGGMMQISAESGLVILATELRLKQLDGSNPPEQVMPSGDKWDDPKYADATEKAYIDYVTEKLVPWFNALARGQERGQVKEVSLSALVDFYYATVDIELNDGTLYELGFASGVLQYIEYYFSSRSMWWDVHYGTWMVDALYRNKVTGETFYTNPPMWE